MEDVRPVFVDEHAGVVVVVVSVAGDVVAAVHDEDLFVAHTGETLGEHAAGESRADDEVIKCHEEER